MITANYTAEGLRGVLKDGGTVRRAAVEALGASVGGTIEALYWMFGTDDLVIICDLHDDEAAVAIGLAVGASGAASVRTAVLLTAEQIDAAAKASPAYRAPGS